MVVNLLVGFPGQQPGGLVLTVLYFLAAGSGAVLAGFAYAVVCATMPRWSLPLQALSSLLRGIPLLLLVFLSAHVSGLSTGAAGLVALLLYSYAHVGEIFRSFLVSYPEHMSEQARVMGITPARELLRLRMPWTLWRAWDAVTTHWVSLLKDTGALVVLSIGEMTTVAKMLSEAPGSSQQWVAVLVLVGAFYLAATLALIRIIQLTAGQLIRVKRFDEAYA